MEHYVIFFCDDCDRLEPAVKAFKKVQPDVVIHTSSSIKDLLARINRKKPELILLYFHDPEKSYVDVLKAVRESVLGRSIPLLVYHDLPAIPELEKAFINYRKSAG